MFVPKAVRLASSDPLFVEFVRSDVGPDGEPAEVEYFNHSTGAWEAEYNATAHMKPLSRLDSIEAHSGFQEFALPIVLMAEQRASAHILAKSGETFRPFAVFGRVMLANLTDW